MVQGQKLRRDRGAILYARRDATIYWHLDESYLGETTENHQISCSVSQGKHLLTLIDNEGNQKKIQFEVK